MKKLVPVVVTFFSVIAAALSIYGLVLAILTRVSDLIAPFAIVAIVLAFTMSVLCCSIGLSFRKSKFCVASGLMTAISTVIAAIAFIILK